MGNGKKGKSGSGWDREMQDWERDLAELGSSVRGLVDSLSEEWAPAVRSVSKTVGRSLRIGLDTAQKAVRQADAPYKKQRRWNKRLKKLRENYEALKWTAFGLGVTSFVMCAVGVIAMFDGDPDVLQMFGFAAAFAIPALICKWKSYPAQRLVAYHRALADRSYCKMEELAAAVDRPVGATTREVRRMLAEGSFEEMYLAPDASRLFTNRTAYNAYLSIQNQKEPEPQAKAAQQEPAPAAPQESGVTQELRIFWRGLRAEKTKIDDPEVLEQVEQLDAQTSQILAWLEGHPQSEASVKRFASYYLPTTLKLLRTYNEVDPQADQSSVAAQIQRDITGILCTINAAFRNLQDGLLKDTAMNVSAEISAMETVLAQDGLKDDGLLGGR